jgi:hypothetical protein
MEIIEIKEKNIQDAAKVLADAFVDDPIFTYIFKTRKNYNHKAEWLFSSWIRWAVMFGNAWITADSNAVIIMRNLGNADMSFKSMVQAGMLKTPIKLGLSCFYRFYFKVLPALDKNHAKVMGRKSHWYGWMVGVKPGHKGEGLYLLNHCAAIADKAKLPIFLETSIERNTCLYEKWNFNTQRILHSDKLGFPLFFMVREPQPVNLKSSHS